MCYSALVKRNLDDLGKKYGAVVVREQIEDYKLASDRDAKQCPPLEDRIYPGYYAPVIFLNNDQRTIELMRYGAYSALPGAVSKKYTTFNARRDNLSSPFWSNAFMHHHGFIVLEAFYEWVAVKDLLEANVVTLEQVKEEFSKQAEERKAKILAQGKKYKPTPTELKDPRPETGEDLVAPVIFSAGCTGNTLFNKGFAIVTDEPPREVECVYRSSRTVVSLIPDAS